MKAYDRKERKMSNSEWIKCSERLPEEDVYVLAHNGAAPFIAAYTTNPSKRWYAISGFTICPTHWMYLPDAPEVEAQLPKEGEWVMCEAEMPYVVGKCSICGGMSRERGHYCPNCGARMKGEQE